MKRADASKSVTERLAALSEMVRLRMLRLLETEELTVGEVAKVLQLPQSTVSRHLKVLTGSGSGSSWLVRRAEGTATHYRLLLDDLPVAERQLWLTVRDQMGSSPELDEDRRRLVAILAERRTDSRTFFGRLAGEWDAVRNELFGHGFTPPALLALLPRDWTVIDVGCGTGNATEHLAPFVKRVIAVDQSEPMLEAAEKRLASLPNVEFRHGQIESLPLEADAADALVCSLVFHHLENPIVAIREFARVLRPGGTALVVDMLTHDRTEYRHSMGHKHLGFSESQMGQMWQEGGFQDFDFTALRCLPEARGPGLFVSTART